MNRRNLSIAARTASAVVLLGLLLTGCGLLPLVLDPPSSRAAIPEEQAVAIARSHAQQFPDGDVLESELGTFLALGSQDIESVPPVPAPSELVWRVTLGYDHGPLNAAAEVFVLRGADGRLVQQYSWIA